MSLDCGQLQHITQVPFAALMRRVGTRPVLLDCLLPGMDLVIWQMRACVREAVDVELRQAALRALEYSVEAPEAGATIYESDGFSFFAFRMRDRTKVLAEMGVEEIQPC